ncbi:3',5'-cyclic-nucleotide phosphodiesterase [Ideonella sp. BN130291]|uniref:3',5'-cyclic-nucleotide phosphodiesterase n=1 Tax=Ideonella sp. BN130291 TaxID=3112940 RepID=UPI002E2747BA|nr:3',5'-cyclic-nucleotide phosphodiesterase [Ideonella sp. BN130291]
MNIRVLGCSGSIAAGSRTTAFLLDDDVLIDAGSGVGDLTLEEMGRIDHILISHSHLDHVLSIGLLADSVLRLRRAQGRPPIRVHALGATIEALKAHIFNNVIWPDFTRLPSAEQPVLAFERFDVGDVLQLGERKVEVLSALHTVPAVGFAVLPEGGGGAWVYTGDTAPNPALWARLREMPVAALVIETAFSDEEHALAELSRHLCPATLARELAHLEGSEVAVYITHIKPGEVTAVMADIAKAGGRHRIQALYTGQRIQLVTSGHRN